MRMVLLILLLLGQSPGWAEETLLPVGPEALAAMRIETAPLRGMPSPRIDSVDGVVAMPASARVAVVVPFGGVVQQLFAAAGDVVAAGQPIARIASRELLDAQAEAADARAELEVARRAADRDGKLLAEGIIPATRAEESRARLVRAEAGATRTRSLLQDLAPGERAGEYVLHAPGAGRIGAVQGAVGETLVAMGVIALVDSGDGRWVDGQLPLSLRPLVSVGARASVRSREMAGTGIAGEVVAVGSGVLPGSQAVPVRVAAVAPDLAPGEAVRMDIEVVVPDGAFAVPAGAVSRTGDEALIFAVRPGGFRPVPVEVLGAIGSQAVVRGTLDPETVIAVRGVSALAAMSAAR